MSIIVKIISVVPPDDTDQMVCVSLLSNDNNREVICKTAAQLSPGGSTQVQLPPRSAAEHLLKFEFFDIGSQNSNKFLLTSLTSFNMHKAEDAAESFKLPTGQVMKVSVNFSATLTPSTGTLPQNKEAVNMNPQSLPQMTQNLNLNILNTPTDGLSQFSNRSNANLPATMLSAQGQPPSPYSYQATSVRSGVPILPLQTVAPVASYATSTRLSSPYVHGPFSRLPVPSPYLPPPLVAPFRPASPRILSQRYGSPTAQYPIYGPGTVLDPNCSPCGSPKVNTGRRSQSISRPAEGWPTAQAWNPTSQISKPVAVPHSYGQPIYSQYGQPVHSTYVSMIPSDPSKCVVGISSNGTSAIQEPSYQGAAHPLEANQTAAGAQQTSVAQNVHATTNQAGNFSTTPASQAWHPTFTGPTSHTRVMSSAPVPYHQYLSQQHPATYNLESSRGSAKPVQTVTAQSRQVGAPVPEGTVGSSYSQPNDYSVHRSDVPSVPPRSRHVPEDLAGFASRVICPEWKDDELWTVKSKAPRCRRKLQTVDRSQASGGCLKKQTRHGSHTGAVQVMASLGSAELSEGGIGATSPQKKTETERKNQNEVQQQFLSRENSSHSSMNINKPRISNSMFTEGGVVFVGPSAKVVLFPFRSIRIAIESIVGLPEVKPQKNQTKHIPCQSPLFIKISHCAYSIKQYLPFDSSLLRHKGLYAVLVPFGIGSNLKIEIYREVRLGLEEYTSKASDSLKDMVSDMTATLLVGGTEIALTEMLQNNKCVASGRITLRPTSEFSKPMWLRGTICLSRDFVPTARPIEEHSWQQSPEPKIVPQPGENSDAVSECKSIIVTVNSLRMESSEAATPSTCTYVCDVALGRDGSFYTAEQSTVQDGTTVRFDSEFQFPYSGEMILRFLMTTCVRPSEPGSVEPTCDSPTELSEHLVGVCALDVGTLFKSGNLCFGGQLPLLRAHSSSPVASLDVVVELSPKVFDTIKLISTVDDSVLRSWAPVNSSAQETESDNEDEFTHAALQYVIEKKVSGEDLGEKARKRIAEDSRQQVMRIRSVPHMKFVPDGNRQLDGKVMREEWKDVWSALPNARAKLLMNKVLKEVPKYSLRKKMEVVCESIQKVPYQKQFAEVMRDLSSRDHIDMLSPKGTIPRSAVNTISEEEEDQAVICSDAGDDEDASCSKGQVNEKDEDDDDDKTLDFGTGGSSKGEVMVVDLPKADKEHDELQNQLTAEGKRIEDNIEQDAELDASAMSDQDDSGLPDGDIKVVEISGEDGDAKEEESSSPEVSSATLDENEFAEAESEIVGECGSVEDRGGEPETSPEEENSVEKINSFEKKGSGDKASMEKKSSAEKQASMEKQPSAEKQASMEKKSSAEKQASMEKQPSAEKQASMEKQPSAEKQASMEKQPSAEKQASMEKQLSAEKQASMEKQPSAEKQASMEKKSSAEKQASMEKQPSAEKQASMEKKSSAEKQASMEKQPSAEKQPLAEKLPSAEKQASMEKQASAEKQAAMEKQPSAEKQASMEKQPSAEKQASMEKQASGEKQASMEKQPSTEKQASMEKQPSAEKQASMEKQPSADKENTAEEESAEKENIAVENSARKSGSLEKQISAEKQKSMEKQASIEKKKSNEGDAVEKQPSAEKENSLENNSALENDDGEPEAIAEKEEDSVEQEEEIEDEDVVLSQSQSAENQSSEKKGSVESLGSLEEADDSDGHEEEPLLVVAKTKSHESQGKTNNEDIDMAIDESAADEVHVENVDAPINHDDDFEDIVVEGGPNAAPLPEIAPPMSNSPWVIKVTTPVGSAENVPLVPGQSPKAANFQPYAAEVTEAVSESVGSSVNSDTCSVEKENLETIDF